MGTDSTYSSHTVKRLIFSLFRARKSAPRCRGGGLLSGFENRQVRQTQAQAHLEASQPVSLLSSWSPGAFISKPEKYLAHRT